MEKKMPKPPKATFLKQSSQLHFNDVSTGCTYLIEVQYVPQGTFLDKAEVHTMLSGLGTTADMSQQLLLRLRKQLKTGDIKVKVMSKLDACTTNTSVTECKSVKLRKGKGGKNDEEEEDDEQEEEEETQEEQSVNPQAQEETTEQMREKAHHKRHRTE